MPIELTPLWQSSNGRCSYCGVGLTSKTATRDHVIPRAFGGGGDENVVLSCKPCNSKKDRMSVEEFRDSEWLAQRRALIEAA